MRLVPGLAQIANGVPIARDPYRAYAPALGRIEEEVLAVPGEPVAVPGGEHPSTVLVRDNERTQSEEMGQEVSKRRKREPTGRHVRFINALAYRDLDPGFRSDDAGRRRPIFPSSIRSLDSVPRRTMANGNVYMDNTTIERS